MPPMEDRTADKSCKSTANARIVMVSSVGYQENIVDRPATRARQLRAKAREGRCGFTKSFKYSWERCRGGSIARTVLRTRSRIKATHSKSNLKWIYQPFINAADAVARTEPFAAALVVEVLMAGSVISVVASGTNWIYR